MPSRARLLEMAEETAAEIAKLEAMLKLARRHEADLRRMAEEAADDGTTELLHTRKRFGSISDVTRKHHALAIAKASAGKDPFRLHITQRGMSQNKVAKKAGCSTAALSRYRSGRPVPTTIANRIQAATEWPADADHWPGGLV